jgi:hypothetical protein
VLRRNGERFVRTLRAASPALAFVAAATAAEPPRLIVEAPAELARLRSEVERLGATSLDRPLRLTGLDDAGPPIFIALEPEGSPAARAAPPWIAGWADGARGLVVLLPARVGRYPDGDLGPLLRHEVTHVLVARAARGRPVPRWFSEGVAMAAGRDWALGDRARVTLAVLSDDSLPIARLDRAFAGGETEVHSAYALAGDLVRELVARHGESVTGAILARVGAGEDFRAAFRATTGARLSEFERDYWSRRTLWDRWVPILSSSVLLWAGAALLVLAAYRRKRRRAAELRERWALEEREAAATDEAPPP